MASIKFDGTLNIPTLLSLIASIVGVVVYIGNVKTEAEVNKSEIKMIKQELAELRQLHMKNTQLIADTTTKVDNNAAQISKVKAITNKVVPILVEAKTKEPTKVDSIVTVKPD